MKIEILGSGGAVTIPKPLCNCKVCNQAREKGQPYTRTGPSVFIHGADVLIDTPEEVKFQLNRSKIMNINACFYSHWHPDHTMGRRVWDMNKDWIGIPPNTKSTDIYLPHNVVGDMKKFLGNWDHLKFMESNGIVKLIELEEEEIVEINKVTIKPFKLAEEYVYGFIVEEASKKALIIMDEHIGWIPNKEYEQFDLVIIPTGIFEYSPLVGERRISEENPVLKMEATFEETIKILKKIDAKKIVLSHIEEPDGNTYDDLRILEKKIKETQNLNISFAFDMQVIEI